MPEETLKDRITTAMKDAMRAREKERLVTIRLVLAAIQQREIDSRTRATSDGAVSEGLANEEVLTVLERMIKQRRESIQQYEQADRQDLADQEKSEIEIIQEFMPAALDEGEIDAWVERAIAETEATSMRDMGKVMALLKPQIQGRVDMSAVSAKIKARLSG